MKTFMLRLVRNITRILAYPIHFLAVKACVDTKNECPQTHANKVVLKKAIFAIIFLIIGSLMAHSHPMLVSEPAWVGTAYTIHAVGAAPIVNAVMAALGFE